MRRNGIWRLITGSSALAITLASPSWPGAAAAPMGFVRVRVTEAGSGQLLPCRLTVLDADGKLATVEPEKAPWIACRPGVIYTGTGEAAFTLAPGRYTLQATRGPEYGLATRPLIAGAEPVSVELRLAHEVDTSGYISCDTHVHTMTYSGHGDCTIEERMATIAGEGIELAIATDHNHHTDYRAAARVTQTESRFTPAIGNEVTTRVGHFNAFPILPGSPPPDFRLTDRKALLAGIRATPGVRVVILNHPSDDHDGFIPTDPRRFHPASGESRDGNPWDFDGIEVVNSAALQSDYMRPYRDWFALLNRGYRMAGIGASDSHDVNRFIVGQARTYVASRAARPDQIDLQEVCENILAGRVLVSMGLFAEVWVDDRYRVGDLATGRSAQMKVRIRVQGPRWIAADRIDLYADGERIASRAVVHPSTAVVKADVTLTLPRPPHDAWLVAIASGPGVDKPYWPIPRPYQPRRADWEPRVIGSTSPVRIDGDGDGRYSSPLDFARRLVDADGSAPDRLMEALRPFDTAVAVQAASLCRERGMDLNRPAFRSAAESAAPHVRQGFVAYQNLLSTLTEAPPACGALAQV
jgi:hypothetical protein